MTGPAKILVVDEHTEYREAIGTILEQDSYQVTMTPDENGAFAAIETERPDLVILDARMSKWSPGFRLVWKLKLDKRYRAIPILIVTGDDDSLSPTDGHGGFDEHVSSDDLLWRVRWTLEHATEIGEFSPVVVDGTGYLSINVHPTV